MFTNPNEPERETKIQFEFSFIRSGISLFEAMNFGDLLLIPFFVKSVTLKYLIPTSTYSLTSIPFFRSTIKCWIKSFLNFDFLIEFIVSVNFT